jgi:hypothetical protein
VLEFADRHRLRPYLNELAAMTQRVFPMARLVDLYYEIDAEDPNLAYLVFELALSAQETDADLQECNRTWTANLFKIVPRPYTAVPVLKFRFDE